jgi:hypothetical protein
MCLVPGFDGDRYRDLTDGGMTGKSMVVNLDYIRP